MYLYTINKQLFCSLKARLVFMELISTKISLFISIRLTKILPPSDT